MTSELITNTLYTLVMTYAINKALSHSPLVNNRWLPIITLLVGFTVGLIMGLVFDQAHLLQNVVAGALGGSMATWLAELVTHTILNIKDEEK